MTHLILKIPLDFGSFKGVKNGKVKVKNYWWSKMVVVSMSTTFNFELNYMKDMFGHILQDFE